MGEEELATTRRPVEPEGPGEGPTERLHARARVRRRGAPPAEADAAAILIHGRGGSAQGMLSLADTLTLPGTALLAPEAAGRSWYPDRFTAPLERNEPWLSSALELLDRTLEELDRHGVGRERTVLVGFSQGACLVLEYAARRGGRFGGVAGLSGGLLGPPDRVWEEETDLEATPVFLGCGDRDAHIPVERVKASEELLEGFGARVKTEIYPGLGHTVIPEEAAHVRRMIEAAGAGGAPWADPPTGELPGG